MLFDNDNLRLKFRWSESLSRNFSQAGQDLFVLSMLDGKRDGLFLDLGCNEPININNTYLLESSYNWKGLSVDIEEGFFKLFVFRKTKTLCADCTNIEWETVIEALGTNRIDYLSLDLEPPVTTLKCLESIPFDKIDFSVITFEHDAYRAGETVRQPSRELLESKGYVRVCSNVKLNDLEFEDWYCNPRYVDENRMTALANRNENWEKIIFK